jgi:hypothetical protein
LKIKHFFFPGCYRPSRNAWAAVALLHSCLIVYFLFEDLNPLVFFFFVLFLPKKK